MMYEDSEHGCAVLALTAALLGAAMIGAVAALALDGADGLILYVAGLTVGVAAYIILGGSGR